MFVPSAAAIAILCVVAYLLGRYAVLRLRRGSSLAQIPGPPLRSFLKGHMDQLFDRKDGPQFHLDLLETYGRVVKVYGFLGDEQLYISDPLALQSILVKNQDNFEETKVFIENNKIIFGEGLVATVGEHHKRQRKLVSPVFSLHRLRRLVPTFYDVAHRLQHAISSVIAEGKKSGPSKQRSTAAYSGASIDMAEWLSRATLESIGQAGLGYSFDPLDSPSNNPYSKAVRALIPTMFRIAPLRLVTPFVTQLGPPAFRRFLLNFVPIQAVQLLKQMSDQMDQTCREILLKKRVEHERKDILKDHGFDNPASPDMSGDGKDIMSILLRANEAAGEKERLSEAELLGQVNVLTFGAQDTTASALSRLIFLLSRPEHAEIQSQLRDEILCAYEKNGDQDFNYDELSGMPLLDAVLKETLRLYPPVPFVRRATRQDTYLPLSQPLGLDDDRTVRSSIYVPAGTTVWVSIAGANRLSDIWGADADEWKPQRWLRAGEHGGIEAMEHVEKGSVRLPGIYSGMLTFLGGGRSCIGYRFALIEIKVILAVLLSSFRFTSTQDRIVWNLSQILSPSVASTDGKDGEVERQGMPIDVEIMT
ncbi:hypothetical protein M0805_006923 [Coniferiporia weirii]|nr:hypothetical protein M0805_006923 [Coniferiporia weirii]